MSGSGAASARLCIQWVLGLALCLGLAPASGQENQFSQGPERTGQAMEFSGTVIGVRNESWRRCHVLRVDRADLSPGLGAGGWALLCSGSARLEIGEQWAGRAVQVDTGWVRAGPHWRVVPLFNIP